MKMLEGTLQETLYDWPDQSLVERGECAPPTVKRQSVYHENEVTYISDQIGLHRISNPDPLNRAVSLHRKITLGLVSRNGESLMID